MQTTIELGHWSKIPIVQAFLLRRRELKNPLRLYYVRDFLIIGEQCVYAFIAMLIQTCVEGANFFTNPVKLREGSIARQIDSMNCNTPTY